MRSAFPALKHLSLVARNHELQLPALQGLVSLKLWLYPPALAYLPLLDSGGTALTSLELIVSNSAAPLPSSSIQLTAANTLVSAGPLCPMHGLLHEVEWRA